MCRSPCGEHTSSSLGRSALLTPLENYLRRRGGGEGYAGGFIDHYITRLLYPAGLTRGTQIILGAAVLLVNVVIYWRLWRRRRDTRISSGARA